MRDRITCRKHSRRHSLHAAMHCATGTKPGDCVDRKQVKRGERCPVWRAREAA